MEFSRVNLSSIQCLAVFERKESSGRPTSLDSHRGKRIWLFKFELVILDPSLMAVATSAVRPKTTMRDLLVVAVTPSEELFIGLDIPFSIALRQGYLITEVRSSTSSAANWFVPWRLVLNNLSACRCQKFVAEEFVLLRGKSDWSPLTLNWAHHARRFALNQ